MAIQSIKSPSKVARILYPDKGKMRVWVRPKFIKSQVHDPCLWHWANDKTYDTVEQASWEGKEDEAHQKNESILRHVFSLFFNQGIKIPLPNESNSLKP